MMTEQIKKAKERRKEKKRRAQSNRGIKTDSIKRAGELVPRRSGSNA